MVVSARNRGPDLVMTMCIPATFLTPGLAPMIWRAGLTVSG